MLEKDRYILSTYSPVETIRETDAARIELAECSLDGKRYVKKTYHSDRREVFDILKNIDSPHIPRVYEVFFGEDTVVIEQYIEGETLEELIAAGHRFKKTETAAIFDGLTEALSVLHKNGIVHRDVKPGNIIVTKEGQAVLIDYSIARIYSERRSGDTELLGTVGYAAPEQFGFAQTDFRTDIYAFGVTMKQFAGRENTSAARLGAIEKCSRFDPDERFRSIEELRRYLGRGRAAAWCLAAAVVLVAVVCVCAVCIWGGQKAPAKGEDSGISEASEGTDSSMSEASEGTDSGMSEAAEQAAGIVYQASGMRIVDTSEAAYEIPCLPLHDNGAYSVTVGLSGETDGVTLTVSKSDTGFQLRTDSGETFSFERDASLSTASYPGGEIYGELLFFDLNGDGALEIVPVICNAVIAPGYDGSQLMLKNYSLGWCIYYDEEAGFVQAEGRMESIFDPFRIYASMPGCINADFPEYYTLDGGVIVKAG